MYTHEQAPGAIPKGTPIVKAVVGDPIPAGTKGTVFGSISVTDGLDSALAGTLCAYLRTHDVTAPNNLARFGAHGRASQPGLATPRNATRV